MSNYEIAAITMSVLAIIATIAGLIFTNLRIRFTKPQVGNIVTRATINQDGSIMVSATITNKCYYDFSICYANLSCNNLLFPAVELARNTFAYSTKTNLFLPSFQSPTFKLFFPTEKVIKSLIGKKAELILYLPNGRKVKSPIDLLNCDNYYREVETTF